MAAHISYLATLIDMRGYTGRKGLLAAKPLRST